MVRMRCLLNASNQNSHHKLFPEQTYFGEKKNCLRSCEYDRYFHIESGWTTGLHREDAQYQLVARQLRGQQLRQLLPTPPLIAPPVPALSSEIYGAMASYDHSNRTTGHQRYGILRNELRQHTIMLSLD